MIICLGFQKKKSGFKVKVIRYSKVFRISISQANVLDVTFRISFPISDFFFRICYGTLPTHIYPAAFTYRSCEAIRADTTDSWLLDAYYMIDPDGTGGEDPFLVWCGIVQGKNALYTGDIIHPFTCRM